MKITIIFLVLSICLVPLAIDGRPDPVVDIDGNVVVIGENYYAVPAMIGPEGGISVANFNVNPENPSIVCPKDIFLNWSKAGKPTKSLPITFINQIPVVKGIPSTQVEENYPVNVKFTDLNPSSDLCVNEMVWKLHEDKTVVTGGVIDNENHVCSWFRVLPNTNNGKGYFFTFWPTLNPKAPRDIPYWHIGTIDNHERLGINDVSPYPFYFVKASSAASK